MQDPHFTLTPPGPVQVLAIYDLLSEFRNKEILEAVERRIEQGFTTFVVDLSAVMVMNSVGINLLIHLRHRSLACKGKLILAGASTKVQHLLEMTKLRPLFHLSASLEAAIQSVTDI